MRSKPANVVIATVLLVILATLIPVSAIININSSLREVTTTKFFMQWNSSNPEAIVTLRWPNPSSGPSHTNTFALGACNSGDVEYFGNSWAPPDPQSGGIVLVGAGTTGTWTQQGSKRIVINSISTGCSNSAGVNVNTSYTFFDPTTPPANKFKVERQFSFTTAFNHNFRPYIPRLFPVGAVSGFNQVLHPNSSGTSLITETVVGLCDFGCPISNWDGSWFAIIDPATGSGVIVVHSSSTDASGNPIPTQLWVDWDGGSDSTASSVLLLSPAGGFTGTVTETEFLCFFGSTNPWTPSLTTPPGCGP